MPTVKMSEIAYNEFKQFLDENGVKTFNIRINLAGMG